MNWKCPACGADDNDENSIKCTCGYMLDNGSQKNVSPVESQSGNKVEVSKYAGFFFASVPRSVVKLFEVIVFAEFLHLSILARWIVALPMLFPSLVIALTPSALYGRRPAAIAIKYLLYFQGITSFIALAAPRPRSEIEVFTTVILAIIYVTTAICFSKNTEISKFYGKILPVESDEDRLEPKTSSIEKYNKNKKYIKFIGIPFIFFSLISIFLELNIKALSFLPVNPRSLSLIFHLVLFALAGVMYHLAKCPACSKFPGNGWAVTECKKCGERLS